LVLDTSAYSHFRAGLVIGQLEAGFVLGRRERENRTLIAVGIS
jgi:hypothetical protein